MASPSLLLTALLALSAPASQGHVVPLPTEENHAAWREYVLPRADELGFESIPWLASFGEGLLAAHEAEKPLLFWGMNGHPLGCT